MTVKITEMNKSQAKRYKIHLHNNKYNKLNSLQITIALITKRPTLAYYGLCILIGKLVQHILMTPIYIMHLIQSLILACTVIRRKEVK